MTGIAVGTFLSFDATEFARAGGGSSYVTFELDQVYTNIASIFYANRKCGRRLGFLHQCLGERHHPIYSGGSGNASDQLGGGNEHADGSILGGIFSDEYVHRPLFLAKA